MHPLVGPVFGDIGQPDPVGRLGGEPAIDETVMDRRTHFLLSPCFLLKTDPIQSCERSQATRIALAPMP